MEAKFENKYIRTPDIMKKFYRSQCFSPIQIIMFVCLALYSIWGWATFLMKYTTDFYIPLFATVLSVGYIAWYVVLYFRMVNSTIRKDIEFNNNQPLDIHITVTDENISCTTPISDWHSEYSSIKRVFQTKHLITIVNISNSAIILPKDSFTLGTPDEFIAFLKQKNVKMRKIPIFHIILISILVVLLMIMIIPIVGILFFNLIGMIL